MSRTTVKTLATDVAELRTLMEGIAAQLAAAPAPATAAPATAPAPATKGCYSSMSAKKAERTRLKALLGHGPDELAGCSIKTLRMMGADAS